ncbi:hypothetical protein CORC01_09714 [Colletotrichum orchidophilum]|uniref:Uncharacterized protein n=1 Tax=Colletotrichum orchidophilum TaxID=1209926 RepID=A0A1G4B110_9PEZI|nr:uncharacterized protein CORC01_09714 [Colletotrichum orchidophilum]OHE95057.1 hypothetical protein CORC01_09714 [Colletotrichum orchidophilum]
MDVLLFDPTLSTSTDSLYVASNHLGFRHLLFANSSESCGIQQEVGLWWKAVKLESLGSLIRFHSDVSIRKPHRVSTSMLTLEREGFKTARSYRY